MKKIIEDNIYFNISAILSIVCCFIVIYLGPQSYSLYLDGQAWEKKWSSNNTDLDIIRDSLLKSRSAGDKLFRGNTYIEEKRDFVKLELTTNKSLENISYQIKNQFIDNDQLISLFISVKKHIVQLNKTTSEAFDFLDKGEVQKAQEKLAEKKALFSTIDTIYSEFLMNYKNEIHKRTIGLHLKALRLMNVNSIAMVFIILLVGANYFLYKKDLLRYRTTRHSDPDSLVEEKNDLSQDENQQSLDF